MVRTKCQPSRSDQEHITVGTVAEPIRDDGFALDDRRLAGRNNQIDPQNQRSISL
jgi:hypothetical protein